eukprot:TRINITY_DN168_c5_g1_i1.p1 TRINITY_DN168_c5_g1~~TRINITY_DN168_c5_g1_i1.p1  ORF type:complete len:286 (+),score=37.66 TRINITY_DN168_c5_g1_i1:41-859(+)
MSESCRIDTSSGGRVYGSIPVIHSDTSSSTDTSHRQTPWKDEHDSKPSQDVRGGVNYFCDGLVANTCILIAVAVLSDFDVTWVLPISTVTLFALAGSAGGAEWVTTILQNENELREFESEKMHLQQFPQEEETHMSHLLSLWGLSEETVDLINRDTKKNPKLMLWLHSKFELGLDIDSPPASPFRYSLTAFLCFSVGAAVPVSPWLPWVYSSPATSLHFTAILVYLCLFFVSLFTCTYTRNHSKTIGRQLIIPSVGFIIVGVAAAIQRSVFM